MSINENWNIRSRSHTCTHSGHPFTDGETFYTALFEDPQTDDLVRRDYSLVSWDALKGELHPFSFWKSVYEAPHSEAKVEVVEKENAEGLLRRLVEEDAPGTENTRYILAIMLERKKILKHTATRETEDANFLIYEHPKTGEVYLIRDPELKLDQVDAVQREVTLLLTHGAHAQVADGTPVEPVPAAAEAASNPESPVSTGKGPENETESGSRPELESQTEQKATVESSAHEATILAESGEPGKAEDSDGNNEDSQEVEETDTGLQPEEESEDEMELLTFVEEDTDVTPAGEPVTGTETASERD